jgi:uncharacterized membrane protein
MKFWRESTATLRMLVLASICLNVVLFTYIGVHWFASSGPGLGAAMPQRMIERVAERLPKEDADLLWGIYRSKEAELLPLQTEFRRALLNAMQLAAQTDLDKPALEAAIRDARDKRLKMGDVVVAMFTEMLERISPKGRRQLVGGYFR